MCLGVCGCLESVFRVYGFRGFPVHNSQFSVYGCRHALCVCCTGVSMLEAVKAHLRGLRFVVGSGQPVQRGITGSPRVIVDWHFWNAAPGEPLHKVCLDPLMHQRAYVASLFTFAPEGEPCAVCQCVDGNLIKAFAGCNAFPYIVSGAVSGPLREGVPLTD